MDPRYEACMRLVAKAGGNALTEDEIAAVFEEVQKRQKRIRDAGAVPDVDGALKKAAGDQAEQLRLAAALQRKHAGLMALARDRVEAKVLDLMAQGLKPHEAVLATLEGTSKAVTGGRASVANRVDAFERRYLAASFGRIEAEVPTFHARRDDPKFSENIVREMYELRDGGQPGRTKDRDAQKVAQIFAAAAEVSRQDLNRLGSYIGKLDGWAGPQAHDRSKMVGKGKTESAWVEFAAKHLDLGRTFPEIHDPNEIMHTLGEVYRTIVTGEDRSTSPKGRGEVTGPASLAKGLVKHRVLHFKDADAWLSYAKEYGRGGIVDGMIHHLKFAGRAAGQMDVLGPNPKALLDGLTESLQKRIRADRSIDGNTAQKWIGQLGEGGKIESSMSVISGLINAPVDISMSKFFSNVRAVQNITKLGGAVISSLGPDMATQASNLSLHGKNPFETYADQLKSYFHGRTRKEAREIGRAVFEGFSGLIDELNHAALGQDLPAGAVAKAQSWFFKWSGLTGWTDLGRAVGARLHAEWMGRHADRTFDKLPGSMQRMFDRHGITAADWDAFRQTAWKHPESGTRYMTPDRLAGNLDQEMKWRGFFADEIGSGILESDAKTRRITTQGLRSGTWAGEALRLVMQFKGFPITFAHRVLGRHWNEAVSSWHAGDKVTAVGNLGHMIAMLTATGYAAMTMKNYLRGYEPMDPTNWKTILAAAKQGGGLGIYGDFLFGEANRFGNGVLETVAGPALGSAAGVANLFQKAKQGDAKAGDAFNTLLQNVPGMSLWWARPAMDYLFLNAFRERLSPGTLARQDESRRKDYGQHRAWGPRL